MLKSTLRVLRVLMHLSSGHVTLLLGEFHPPEFFPQLDLGHRADSRWPLPQLSSSLYVVDYTKQMILLIS